MQSARARPPFRSPGLRFRRRFVLALRVGGELCVLSLCLPHHSIKQSAQPRERRAAVLGMSRLCCRGEGISCSLFHCCGPSSFRIVLTASFPNPRGRFVAPSLPTFSPRRAGGVRVQWPRSPLDGRLAVLHGLGLCRHQEHRRRDGVRLCGLLVVLPRGRRDPRQGRLPPRHHHLVRVRGNSRSSSKRITRPARCLFAVGSGRCSTCACAPYFLS